MLPHPPSDHLHHFERRLHLCQVVLWLHEKFEHQPGGDVVNSGTSKASVYEDYTDMCARANLQVLLSRAVLGKMVKRAFPDVVTVRRGARGSTKEHYVGLARRQRPIVKAEPEPDHVEDDDQQQNTTSTSTSTSTTTSTPTSTSSSTSLFPSSPIQTQALKLPLTSARCPMPAANLAAATPLCFCEPPVPWPPQPLQAQAGDRSHQPRPLPPPAPPTRPPPFKDDDRPPAVRWAESIISPITTTIITTITTITTPALPTASSIRPSGSRPPPPAPFRSSQAQ